MNTYHRRIVLLSNGMYETLAIKELVLLTNALIIGYSASSIGYQMWGYHVVTYE